MRMKLFLYLPNIEPFRTHLSNYLVFIFLFFYVIVYFYCLKCIGILAKSLQIYRYNRVLYISKHISKLHNQTYLALLWNRAKKLFHSNIKLMQFFSCELKAHQSVVLKLFKLCDQIQWLKKSPKLLVCSSYRIHKHSRP